MRQIGRERVAYLDGRIIPESQVLLPLRDRGFTRGDAVYDATRTFAGRLFKPREHIARLYRSLRYVQIEPRLTPEEMLQITEEVVRQNAPLLRDDEDYWVIQRVSRGLDAADQPIWNRDGPTIIVECQMLPLRERAALFQRGIRVCIPAVRRTPPESLSPRAKTQNYLNLILADLQVRARDPEAWPILLDAHGNLTEGRGANIFIVRDGRLYTPREHFVLPGISRQIVIELATDLGIGAEEADIDLFDAHNADEAFITSTSLCVCPVQSINAVKLKYPAVPGPVTQRIIDAYKTVAGFDFYAQYLQHLGAVA
jgi:branched-chain amino acid aminotransferase